jgi:hypothetical protein
MHTGARARHNRTSVSKESFMSVVSLLVTGYIVVMGFWIVNHFYYKNVKYEQAYKRGERPKW